VIHKKKQDTLCDRRVIFGELIFMTLSAQRRKHMDGIANFVLCLLQALYAVSTDQAANSLVSISEWREVLSDR
jgi:hypothetical protein